MLKPYQEKGIRSKLILPITRLIHFAELGKMYTSLMHDLTSPITALTIYVSKHAPHDAYGSVIVDSSKQIQNFLLLARTTPQHIRTVCHMHPLLKNTIQLLGYTALQQNVRLVLLGDAQTVFFGNSMQLQHVFINLITNAIDSYTTVTTKNTHQRTVTISYQDEDDSIKIHVRDFGCGMTPEIKRKSTRLFFTTKKYGSGIGLSFSKTIIEKYYKGTLRITSIENKGTCATITLPKNSPPTEHQQMNYQDHIHLKNMKEEH